MDSNHSYHKSVGVIGAGKFGTFVANLLTHNAETVWLYTNQPNFAALIKEQRSAAGQHLAETICITNNLVELTTNCLIIFPIIPATCFRSLMQKLAPYLTRKHILIHGTKGLDVIWPIQEKNLSRADVYSISEVIQAESKIEQIGYLGGPNLVSELIKEQPAATVVASKFAHVIAHGKFLLQNSNFQVYQSTDLLGVELCGVLKNIFAIGSGILHGMGYGENTKALLISQGLIEMMRIGVAMGAHKKTFIGVAGVGDLLATCSSTMSRNFISGSHIAQGLSLAEIMDKKETIEGINTVKIIYYLKNYYQLKMPITETIYKILFEALDVQKALHDLMRSTLDEAINSTNI